MSCEEFGLWVQRPQGDEMEAPAMAAFRLHQEQCPDCAFLLESTRAFDETLRNEILGETPDPGSRRQPRPDPNPAGQQRVPALAADRCGSTPDAWCSGNVAGFRTNRQHADFSGGSGSQPGSENEQSAPVATVHSRHAASPGAIQSWLERRAGPVASRLHSGKGQGVQDRWPACAASGVYRWHASSFGVLPCRQRAARHAANYRGRYRCSRFPSRETLGNRGRCGSPRTLRRSSPTSQFSVDIRRHAILEFLKSGVEQPWQTKSFIQPNTLVAAPSSSASRSARRPKRVRRG